MPRNFATFGPSEIQPPFTGVYSRSLNFFYYSCSTGQASISILLLSNLQRPVVLLTSRCSQFCASFSKVTLRKLLLLPKLRSYFAEFLQYNSLKRLNFLNLFTCVGLQYGFFERFFQKILKNFYLITIK